MLGVRTMPRTQNEDRIGVNQLMIILETGNPSGPMRAHENNNKPEKQDEDALEERFDKCLRHLINCCIALVYGSFSDFLWVGAINSNSNSNSNTNTNSNRFATAFDTLVHICNQLNIFSIDRIGYL